MKCVHNQFLNGIRTKKLRLEFRDAIGERYPDVGGPLVRHRSCDVKARASGRGFATLERWLGDDDALFLRCDRVDPLIVLPWAT